MQLLHKAIGGEGDEKVGILIPRRGQTERLRAGQRSAWRLYTIHEHIIHYKSTMLQIEVHYAQTVHEQPQVTDREEKLHPETRHIQTIYISTL